MAVMLEARILRLAVGTDVSFPPAPPPLPVFSVTGVDAPPDPPPHDQQVGLNGRRIPLD